MIYCKSKCKDFVSKGSIKGGRYANGQKRCNVCNEFLEWDGRFCPCCSSMLRLNPRDSNLRKKTISEKRI